MSASIKVTLYSNEGPSPSIVIAASFPLEAAQIEWLALIGMAEHALRKYREFFGEAQITALENLVALAKL